MRRMILLADDRIKTSEALFELLSPEYDVVMSDSVDKAEAAANDRIPDMIIFNLAIEGGRGLELLNRIKKIGRIPVMVIISAMNEDLREYTRDGRVLDFILKPVDTELLLNRIRNFFAMDDGNELGVEYN